MFQVHISWEPGSAFARVIRAINLFFASVGLGVWLAWAATPPKVIDLPMATLQERHPTPTWLPEASQALFRKGLAAITSPEFLQTPGLNHSHFLPAYCALTMAGFQREHLQLVCGARIAASFGPSVVAPLLMGNTSEVQTYLDNVISSCDPTWSHLLPKQRSRPTLSAPNDDLILPWNHKNIHRKLPCYIDDLYKRLAALSAQLAGHDMPKSPQGWVTLSTIRKYTGPDVQGNVDVGSQNIVATRPFTITSNDSMIPLTFELLEVLVTADGRRGQTRFQLGQFPAGKGKEIVIRLRPDLPVTSSVGASPSSADRKDHLPQMGAHFCHEFMLSVLTRSGINPNPRRKDDGSPLLKVIGLESVSDSGLRTAFSSPLRGKADVLIVVSLLSAAQTGVKWVIGPNNLFGTNDTPIRPIHLISAYQFRPPFDGDGNPQLLRVLWTNELLHGQAPAQSAAPPLYTVPAVPSAFDDQLNAQADLRYRSQLREPPAPAIPAEDDDTSDDDPFEEQTPTQEMEEAFASLLLSIDQNTHQLMADISPKDYLAMSQLPLSYPWSRLVFDFKDLHTAWDRHIITCLVAAAAGGMPSPHPGSVLAAFLKKLAQIIANIVYPQNADVPPPFLDNRIVSPEFWHAHLNYACSQAELSQKGQERRLVGNQLCYWTSADADHCMKVTHLIVHLPPALGAYILQQHQVKGKISIPTAEQTLLGEGTIARTQQDVNFPMPDILDNQAEALLNAREAAAQGVLSPATIPLLADSQNLHGHHKLHWTLRFPPRALLRLAISDVSQPPHRGMGPEVIKPWPGPSGMLPRSIIPPLKILCSRMFLFYGCRMSFSALDLL